MLTAQDGVLGVLPTAAARIQTDRMELQRNRGNGTVTLHARPPSGESTTSGRGRKAASSTRGRGGGRGTNTGRVGAGQGTVLYLAPQARASACTSLLGFDLYSAPPVEWHALAVSSTIA